MPAHDWCIATRSGRNVDFIGGSLPTSTSSTKLGIEYKIIENLHLWMSVSLTQSLIIIYPWGFCMLWCSMRWSFNSRILLSFLSSDVDRTIHRRHSFLAFIFIFWAMIRLWVLAHLVIFISYIFDCLSLGLSLKLVFGDAEFLWTISLFVWVETLYGLTTIPAGPFRPLRYRLRVIIIIEFAFLWADHTIFQFNILHINGQICGC
jgi:hypothetical protein